MKLTDKLLTKGNIIFSNDEIAIIETNNDIVVESWRCSTKHPDTVYFFSEWTDKTSYFDDKEQIPQWLLYIASRQLFPFHAMEYAQIALDMMNL